MYYLPFGSRAWNWDNEIIMKKIKIDWARSKVYILPVLAGVVTAVVLFIIINLIKSGNRIVVKPQAIPTGIVIPTTTPTPDPNADFAFLIMGYAGGNHDGSGLTDTIMVAVVQPKKERIVLISIPRDLWVNLPLSTDTEKEYWYKINAAYVLGKDDRNYPNKAIEFTGEAGGGMVAKYVVGQVLGINIDYFGAIDFDGFTKAIDSLGGVKVKVTRSFEDPYYPLTDMENDTCGKTEEEIMALEATMSGWKLEESYGCRFETLKFEAGLVEMDGATALKYARSRHSPTDGGDFNRSRRQKEVIEAVKEKVVSIGFLPKIVSLINQLSYHVQTDADLDRIGMWLGRAGEFFDYQTESITLSTGNVLVEGKSQSGQYVLMTDDGLGNWDKIHEYIKNVLEDNNSIID